MSSCLAGWLTNPKRFWIIGIVMLASAVFTYFPSLSAGLYRDDWQYLERMGRKSLFDYLSSVWDPRAQAAWYRPAQGTFGLIEYTLFHSNFVGYHVVQVALHLINGFLLFAIIQRVSRNWRLGILSAIVYAELPAYSLSVIWFTVADPFSGMFYLAAVLFWIIYLQNGSRFAPLPTYVAFILLLLSKETGITLPVVLVLVDLWLLRAKFDLKEFARRYIPFGIVLLPYLFVQWSIQARGWYTHGTGYGLGPHVITNLIRYFGILAFPWAEDTLLNRIALVIALLLLIWVTISKRTWLLVFLGLFALFNIAPVIGFTANYFQTRFLYLPAVATAVAFALLFERGLTWFARRKWYGGFASIVLGGLVVASGLGVGEASASFAEMSRKERVVFRDISLRHPTFPPDTFLYFIVPHGFYMEYVSGMFFLRYGSGVNMRISNEGRPAGLRDHNQSYVYYFDNTGRPIEAAVDKNARTQTSLALPISFVEPLRLEGYEVTRTQVKRGESLVLLLYWRAQHRIAKDYTLFAHLVDQHGEIVAGYDSQPKQASFPTSLWQPNEFVVDSIIMPIPSDAPIDTNYRLELGLYALATMERLGIPDSTGRAITDTFVIEPFSVEE